MPILGNLFGTNGIKGVRTELLVVITPRVVRSDIDIREVSDDLRDRMKGLKAVDLNERGRSDSPVPMPAPTQPLLAN